MEAFPHVSKESQSVYDTIRIPEDNLERAMCEAVKVKP
jgi:hypothetical protein